nr:MAG TPA: hypothetical protein [Caudoviricetes sp.]
MSLTCRPPSNANRSDTDKLNSCYKHCCPFYPYQSLNFRVFGGQLNR